MEYNLAISFYRKIITIDHFAITHNNQHIIISGLATPNKKDSVIADLKSVDVSYIMNLVNFILLILAEKEASGKHIAGALPAWSIQLNYEFEDFKFENGRMGTLCTYTIGIIVKDK